MVAKWAKKNWILSVIKNLLNKNHKKKFKIKIKFYVLLIRLLRQRYQRFLEAKNKNIPTYIVKAKHEIFILAGGFVINL